MNNSQAPQLLTRLRLVTCTTCSTEYAVQVLHELPTPQTDRLGKVIVCVTNERRHGDFGRFLSREKIRYLPTYYLPFKECQSTISSHSSPYMSTWGRQLGMPLTTYRQISLGLTLH